MFDYLGVLLSVILGLALTNVLSSFSGLIQMRQTIRIYWVQLVWAAAIVIYVLAVWWGMFWWRQLGDWRFEQFLFLIGYAIVIYVMAATLFPMTLTERTSCEEYFFANRRWFFGLVTLAQLLDVPENAQQASARRASGRICFGPSGLSDAERVGPHQRRMTPAAAL